MSVNHRLFFSNFTTVHTFKNLYSRKEYHMYFEKIPRAVGYSDTILPERFSSREHINIPSSPRIACRRGREAPRTRSHIILYPNVFIELKPPMYLAIITDANTPSFFYVSGKWILENAVTSLLSSPESKVWQYTYKDFLKSPSSKKKSKNKHLS